MFDERLSHRGSSMTETLGDQQSKTRRRRRARDGKHFPSPGHKATVVNFRLFPPQSRSQ
jgi:hypothetical protein